MLLSALDAHVGPHVARGALLAVSGGADSRALLEAAARWPRRCDGVVHVASVDHATRASSRAESEAVVARAKVLGFDASLLSLPRSSLSSQKDEASLRHARYAALTERAEQLGLGVVVVAHHAGDVAEGALMSWLGQGGGGAAMAPLRPLSSTVTLLRPFLDVPRAALRAALCAMGTNDVVIDPDSTSVRARLRGHELAALGAHRGGVEAALARAATQRRDDDDALAALAVVDEDGCVRAGPPAVVRRALRRALVDVLGDVVDVRASAPALEVVLRLMQRGTPGEVHLTGAIATVTPDASAGAQRGAMRVRIRARDRTVADSTASTHDGVGTSLSKPHLLLTLQTAAHQSPYEDQEDT